MIGLELSVLTSDLHKVREEYVTNPVRSIENVTEKLARSKQYIEAYYSSFDFYSQFHELPLNELSDFTFEDLCKMRFSSAKIMDRTVDEVFEKDPNHEVVRKIQSSWWRWGVGKGTWNELVDVYNGIRSYSLGLPPEFELRLDYTTGYNQFGYSKYARTFIDGVFAFLVYHRQKHVMTVSFSVMENRRLLIQQVQLTNPSGNRWLYQLPTARLEFIITAFERSFPNYTLYMIDGASLVNKTLADYQSCINRVQDWLERNEVVPEGITSATRRHDKLNELAEVTDGYEHLKDDLPRIAQLYAQCGKYALSKQLVVNQMIHRELVLQS
ncbi:MAG: hypothetical protein V4606_03815 [Patescibacteria group bacterium]